MLKPTDVLKVYLWPWLSLQLAKLFIVTLIRTFDEQRAVYMLLLFPAYQVATVAGTVLTIAFIDGAMKEPGLWLACIPIALFISIPFLVSWHLAFFLFARGYFEIFAAIGFPLAEFACRVCDLFINMFRRLCED